MRTLSPGPTSRSSPPTTKRSLPDEHGGDLLVRMLVLGDDGTGAEGDLREGHRLAVQHPAADTGAQLLDRLVVPAEDVHAVQSMCASPVP